MSQGAAVTCAGCNNIEVHPVKLVNGTTVCNSCPAWRHQTEAEHILKLPTLADRRAWLEVIAKKRGEPAREALQKTMGELWQAARR